MDDDRTPANWYTDPSGRADQRYFDGTLWTDRVARIGIAANDPLEPGEAYLKPTASDAYRGFWGRPGRRTLWSRIRRRPRGYDEA